MCLGRPWILIDCLCDWLPVTVYQFWLQTVAQHESRARMNDTPVCKTTPPHPPPPHPSTKEVDCDMSQWLLLPALTPIMMKCFHRLVMRHIKSTLPTSLDPLQFAYHSNRSTDYAISYTLHSYLTWTSTAPLLECSSSTVYENYSSLHNHPPEAGRGIFPAGPQYLPL